ncbi:hypothetical protein [Streptomyces sp. NBC_01235]|uniref:hypothetical protein n=1 Tax=Streptomyces sp. NBC_01235 TaxID=2903788 RepID=UPI002E111628|nr:hypothetical protein OG289_26635 [Streptomyces sp. NBC_01235]
MPHATIAPARKSRTRRPAPARHGAVRHPAPASAPAWTVMPLWQALLPDGDAVTDGARP